jgi:pimeloyl-ACP methyl ester carboxylesterase
VSEGLTERIVRLPSGPAGIAEAGRGPAVVCVHGLPGSSRDFRWLAAPLAGRARLVSVDLPGFGRTPVASGEDPSPEGRAAFVLGVIDALGLERPAIVGHSMGGLTAAAAVSARPEGFRGLGLLASPGLRPHRSFQRIPRRSLHAATKGPWAPLLRPLVRRLFAGAGFRGYPDEALARTIACLRATSFEAHAARLGALCLPTLTAWCEDDPLIEREVLAELDAALPPGPRLRWALGGHVPQKQHAAAVADAIAELARG